MTGISETKDAINFAQSIIDDLHKHMKEGKLDTASIALIMIENIPETIRAIAGSKDINAEIKDLDEAEKEELAKMAINLSKSIVSFFIPGVIKS